MKCLVSCVSSLSLAPRRSAKKKIGHFVSQPKKIRKLGPHERLVWGHPGDSLILVHTELATFKADVSGGEIYDRAKHHGDFDAAAELVSRCVDGAKIDTIVDAVMSAGTPPIFAMPFPAFNDDDGDGHDVGSAGVQNAIPFTLAAYLAEIIGGEVSNDIVQAARVGRTKLGPFPRFLFQPTFTGAVVKRPYILVDDAYTMGGSLASLRSHVVKGGGTVIAITALAHKDGFDQLFAIKPETVSELFAEYGEEIDELWKERIGHEISCLTENEGQTLVRFAASQAPERNQFARLQALRDRLSEAAAKCE